MKTAGILAIILGTIGLVVVLVAAIGVVVVWGQGSWASSTGPGMMGFGRQGDEYGYGMMGSGPGYGMMGPGMMGSGPGYAMMGPGMMGAYRAPSAGEASTLAEAEAAFLEYSEALGYPDLSVSEVMEFENNYYAILAEKDTGTGAMELLLDKGSGFVGPEPGPNMMWNSKYGMMGGGMMGGSATGETVLSPEQAQGEAQRWLDANLPGRTAGEADAFYGYYTLHFLQDGEIDGMLSVNGSTGAVWYHGWHGDFLSMAEENG